MALDLTHFDADLENIEADVAQAVTIGGTSYAAIVSGQVSGKDWQASGYLPENAIEVVIRLSVLNGATVNAGTLVTFNSTVYRVISKETDPVPTAIRLICEEKQR
jgi:hypothetical protein